MVHKLKKGRYLLKLSGEVLKGTQDYGISWEYIDRFCDRLVSIIKTGVQLGFVVGGGNIFRGAEGNLKGYDRIKGDQIGMLSTVLNGLALAERFRAKDIPVVIQSGIKIDGIAELFNLDKINDVFDKGGAVIFCGGIGNPYFSTDTTSALRAIQIGAEYVLKSTKVDGIFDKDPVKYNDARMYEKITFDEIIEQKLRVMDLTSVLLMKENSMKLMVFNMTKEGLLEKACSGEKVGTIVEK